MLNNFRMIRMLPCKNDQILVATVNMLCQILENDLTDETETKKYWPIWGHLETKAHKYCNRSSPTDQSKMTVTPAMRDNES